MLQHMTSPQLTELEAFWQLEGGWGDFKQDFRFGQLCSIHANINRDSKKKRDPYKPEDFALRPRAPQREENTQEIRGKMDMLAGKKS